MNTSKIQFVLMKSDKSDKKLMLVTQSGRKIHFGSAGMDDFTKTGDEAQKDRYIKRHLKEDKFWTMTI